MPDLISFFLSFGPTNKKYLILVETSGGILRGGSPQPLFRFFGKIIGGFWEYPENPPNSI